MWMAHQGLHLVILVHSIIPFMGEGITQEIPNS